MSENRVYPENDFAKRLFDKILENSSYTDGLTDAEAVFYNQWALMQANLVSRNIQTEEDYEEVERPFSRMLRTINALVLGRHDNDAEWLDARFDKLNSYAEGIHGGFLDEQERIVLHQHHHLDNMSFLAILTSMMAPELELPSDEVVEEALRLSQELNVADLVPPDVDTPSLEAENTTADSEPSEDSSFAEDDGTVNANSESPLSDDNE